MDDQIVHEQFVKLATRLIKENGREVHLLIAKNAPEKWNPTPTGEVVKQEVVVVNIDSELGQVDGDLILHNDRLFIVDSKVAITYEMKFLDDDDVLYTIVNINHLRVGKTSIMYTLQVRR